MHLKLRVWIRDHSSVSVLASNNLSKTQVCSQALPQISEWDMQILGPFWPVVIFVEPNHIGRWYQETTNHLLVWSSPGSYTSSCL